MTAQPAHTAEAWGRLTLVTKEPADDSDHIYLTRPVTTIGRNKRRCDHVINQLFISSVHCVVQRDGIDASGEPIVKLCDNSRNGIWVNADRVGKGGSVRLGRGYTVHFTKPGATPAGVTPMAFKLEFLTSTGPQPVAVESKVSEVLQDVDPTTVSDELFDATTKCAVPAESPYLPAKKRKRVGVELGFVHAATQELESKPEAAESQLKAAKAMVAMEKGLEQIGTSQVDKLTKENLHLMAELQAASAENLQLKAELAAKDGEMKTKEAALQATAKLHEELGAKQKEAEVKNKQALTKRFEADCEATSREMAVKLKEELKKYQQKIEAEHYEQRREASEKMAALVNENETLQTLQSAKDEELADCEVELARSREEITTLEKRVATLCAKEEKLADCKKKIADLESKLAVLKEESAEIVGLLAAAEEKVVAAENKAAKADIAAAAAARARANSSFDANERQELQNSISSFRCELEAYRAQLTSREKHTTQQAAALQVAMASSASSTAERVIQDNNADTLRARLVAASDLFRHVQALGLQGMRLINETNRSKLSDLPCELAATIDTRTIVPNSPSFSPAKDGRHLAEADTTTATIDNGSAKAKASPTTLKPGEKPEPNKQAALASAAIDTDIDASARSAATTSFTASGHNLCRDVRTVVVHSDDKDEWDVIE
ncbi:unnamed protein product [Hyaloperonospora brassicae]|uniref:FHA domain-containing protein n=1 Tax=Hyaloperonospora brassicae TaxID=162125 RepID=A0AAV0UUM0_HYABA|nr:unnamed protein product [Hyaloperonospora brassicae]